METGSDTAGKPCYSSSLMSPENGFDTREAIGLEGWAEIQGLLEASRTALISISDVLEVTSWCSAAELIFGWKAEEIVGRGISLLGPKGGLKGFLASPQLAHFECSCQTKAGKSVAVRIWSCPTPANAARRPLLISDVTELKFLENAFLGAEEREQQRIGREMHDHLCQHLLGAAFAVKALAGDLDREGSRHAGRLHELARLVNEAVVQVRDISRGLSPAELEAGGLAGCSSRIGNQGQSHHSLRVSRREKRAHEEFRPGAARISDGTSCG